MNILITGGAGFIGSRLSQELVNQGHNVTIFDSLHPQVHFQNETNFKIAKASGAALIVGDVRSRDDLQNAVRTAQPDYIFHLAAETGTGQSFDHPTRYNEVNIIGTTNLIEAVRSEASSVRRIILAGSRSVYGEGACVDADNTPVVAVARTNEDMAQGEYRPKSACGKLLTPVPTNADICPAMPASIYASTKLMQEYLLTQAFWGTSTEVGILRLQNVYGPGQSMSNPYTGVISIFSDQIMQGKVLNIFEDGEITRDFVYVDDVVQAFASTVALESFSDEIVDIGAGEAATIIDVAKQLIALVGDERNGVKVTGDFRAGDIRYALADISKAQKLLNWSPKVSVAQGLENFSKWAKGA
jgi:dTDP-L-rhamnose 4-epimerase